jgi:hypothetical protein
VTSDIMIPCCKNVKCIIYILSIDLKAKAKLMNAKESKWWVGYVYNVMGIFSMICS